MTGANSRPMGVRRTDRVLRSSRRTPSAVSNCLICTVNVGCETCTVFAACVKLACRAAATNACRCLNSTSIAIR